MTEPRQFPVPDDASDPLRYQVRVGRVVVWAGLLFFTLAVLLAWRLLRNWAPPALMRGWLVASTLFLLSWLGIGIAVLRRGANNPALVGVWEFVANYVRLGSNLIVLATIWLFLPHAPRELQLTLTVFYVAHVATQILTVPARGRINAAGAIVVLGSTAIVLLRSGDGPDRIVALFVASYALVMASMALVLGRLLGRAIAARRRSDELAEQIRQALAEVAAERDAKTRFIAAASHDLGQPLQAANLFFGQLQRASDDGQRSAAADGVRRAFASAEQLLSHMLNHLRLEADAVDPQMGLVEVGDAVRRAVELHRGAAGEAGIALRPVPGRGIAFCDRTLLDRALGNLVDNAIRHSQGQRVLVGTRRAPQARLRIWVIDDGVGVAGHERETIFEDYVRGAQTARASRLGFGLGLSSVRRIAALLGGEVGIEPGWRSGAAFYLELPGALSVAAGARQFGRQGARR